MSRRLGLLGGTFDPPHLGHLAAALAVRDALELDSVWLVVANDPWQKSSARAVTPAPIRLEMTRALVNGHSGLAVDDREIVRGGPSYTADTLEEITREDPGVELFLIVGSDTARKIATWNRPSDVVALSTLVVVNRPSDDSTVPDGVPADRCVFVQMNPVAVSSTDIRARVGRGETIADLTGDAVAEIVAAHHLYSVAA